PARQTEITAHCATEDRASQAMDPIHQFAIEPIFTFGHGFAFTNSAFFMLLAVVLTALLMIASTSSRAVIPGRWQALAETFYEFVAGTVRGSAGVEGMRFMPFVFSVLMFVLMCNMLGLIPGFFSVPSHIIIPFALAALVISVVIIY